MSFIEKLGWKQIGENVFEGFKIITIDDFKTESNDSGDTFVSGYVNTKGKPDAYGDIPMGENVYDLSRYKKNPVLLVDHNNSAGFIAGKSVLQTEDDKGFFNKFLLMKNPQTELVKHAIEAVKEGILKAFSIGGQWKFEDKQNPTYLTKAIIHEISLVAIGADPRALVSSVGSKSLQSNESEKLAVLEYLIKKYRETKDPFILAGIESLKQGVF